MLRRISISGTSNLLITNTGVTSAVAGSGIGVSGSNSAVTFSNTGVLSNTAGAGISVSAGTGNVTIGNTGVLSAQSLTGTIGFTSPDSSITIGTSGSNITLVAPAGGPTLAPITAFAWTDSITSINTAGGITNSPNIWTVPTTGIYLMTFSFYFATSATGGGPFTEVSFNPVAREFIWANMASASSPFNNGNGYVSYLTTLPNTAFYSQTPAFTSAVALTAGKQLFLQSIVQNSGTVFWGYAQVGVSVTQLC